MRKIVFVAFLFLIVVVYQRRKNTNAVEEAETAKQPTPAVPARFETDYPKLYNEVELEARAADAFEPVIFGRMADPVHAAHHTAGLMPIITSAANRYDVPTGELAALVFLEASGNVFAVSPANAAGIVQMLASVARKYGLKVNATRAKPLLSRRRRALRELADELDVARMPVNACCEDLDSPKAKKISARTLARAKKLRLLIAECERKLEQSDERFQPRKAIPAAAEYLADHYQDYGRWDLTFAAYHMGGPNLQRVLRNYCYGHLEWKGSVAETVEAHDLSWAKIFFDTTPSRHPLTYRTLWGLGDHSRNYWFRILAAQSAFELWQSDQKRFKQLVELYKHPRVPRRYELAREVIWYRPDDPATVGRWEDWESLEEAYEANELVYLPEDADRFGFKLDSRIGSLAGLEVPRSVYCGLRPSAAGLLCYLAAAVRKECGEDAVLTVSSLVRSRAYQARIVSKGMSPSLFSGHCAGVSMDILPPRSSKVSRALRFTLEQLRTLGDIVWIREGDHFHVTIAEPSRDKFAGVWARADQLWQLAEARDNRPLEVASRDEATTSGGSWLGWIVHKILLLWLVGLIPAWLWVRTQREIEGEHGTHLVVAALWPVLALIRGYSHYRAA